MASVIIASVIMASVTIMASITYGKCDLWQVLLMANVIMAKVFMANVLWQMKLSPQPYRAKSIWDKNSLIGIGLKVSKVKILLEVRL